MIYIYTLIWKQYSLRMISLSPEDHHPLESIGLNETETAWLPRLQVRFERGCPIGKSRQSQQNNNRLEMVRPMTMAGHKTPALASRIFFLPPSSAPLTSFKIFRVLSARDLPSFRCLNPRDQYLPYLFRRAQLQLFHVSRWKS